MIDLSLRAENDLELILACPFLMIDGEWIMASEKFNLDIIGPIVTSDGEYEEDGNELAPPEIDHRFHANLRCSEEIAQKVPENVIVYPKNPVRVWA